MNLILKCDLIVLLLIVIISISVTESYLIFIQVLKKLPSYLKMPKLEVTDEYIESFIKANNTFLYQLVFCPQKKCLVPLNPYPEGVEASDMEYAGKYPLS